MTIKGGSHFKTYDSAAKCSASPSILVKPFDCKAVFTLTIHMHGILRHLLSHLSKHLKFKYLSEGEARNSPVTDATLALEVLFVAASVCLLICK